MNKRQGNHGKSSIFSLKSLSDRGAALIKTEKGKKIVILIGIVLIALIFLSSFLERESKAPQSDIEDAITLDAYVNELELRVSELLSKIQGVGEVDVMITLESSAEYIYQSEKRQASGNRTGNAGEQQKSNEQQESIVMVEDDNGKKQALIRTEKTPTIQGVVVVCEGGGDIAVQSQIIDVLTAAFSIPSNRISVAAAESAQNSPTEESGVID